MLDILVTDVPSSYNMILGRSGLNGLQVVPSTYHMVVKFPTANGVGEVRGDLCSARECYMASIGVARGVETLRRKIEENPGQEETSNHKKDLDGEKVGNFHQPLVSYWRGRRILTWQSE